MCKTEGCNREKHTRGMCSTCYQRHYRKFGKRPQSTCKADECLNKTASKWGYCETHKQKGQWAAQKQAKQEWFARQPEENITDAVIRYALNNDIALKLFTNTKTEGDCLVWKGAVSSNGYGHIAIRVRFGKGEGKHFAHPVLTHRLAYATCNELPPSQSGPRPDTLTINHICRNRLCVNPSHLEVLTQQENWEYAGGPGVRNMSEFIDMNVKGTCLCGADFVGRANRKWCSDKCKDKHRYLNKKSAA